MSKHLRTVLKMVFLVGLAIFFALSGVQAILSASTPMPGPVVMPVPTGTPNPKNVIQGTVASIYQNEITINVKQGQLKTITVPNSVPVVRNSQPSTLSAIQATDKIFIQKDEEGKIVSVLAIAAPQPSPTIAMPRFTPTPGISITPALSVQSSPTATTSLLTGTIRSINGTKLTILADSGFEQTVDLSGAQITRNGKQAQTAVLKKGDIVTLVRSPNGEVTQLTATSETVEHDLSWIWISVLLMLPFLLLLTIPFGLHRRRLLRRS